jgi:multidrug resistance efflux pump
MLDFARIRFTAALAAALLLPAVAGAAPTRKPTRPHAARTGKRTAKRGVKPPLLPPAQVRARDMLQLRVREELLREQLERAERALRESRSREKQTEAKLQEVEILSGRTDGAATPTDAKLAHLVDLYHRLQTIDKERSQLQASTKPDTHAIKELENERDAIFQWVRAELGDMGAVAIAKTGPTQEALMAVQVARVEVEAAEKELQRARDLSNQNLGSRGEALRAESELARARANLARAEARVSGDKASEVKAAQAQADAAQADLNEAEANLVRLWNLKRAGAVARVEVDAADLRVRKARSALESAKADVKRLKER